LVAEQTRVTLHGGARTGKKNKTTMTFHRHPGESRDPVPRLEKNRARHPQRGGALVRTILVLLVLGAIAAGLLLWLDYHRFTDAPLTIERTDATFDVARGASYRDIVRQLHEAGVTRESPWYWRALGHELGVEGKLHAGEYALMQGLTPRQLLLKMAAGEVLQHQFTIVDGWTFKQLRLALAADPGLKQTLPGLSDEAIAERLQIEGGNPEGWFLPETYAWVKGESDFDVLSRAHAAMHKALDRLWAAREPDPRLETPYQALILASIVEKETGRPDERPLIAGVFMRRLKFNMRLQTDPTVISGMGENYRGNIRREDLEGDTPYNTYTRDGLPPTPIALPGTAALEAALHPAPGDALYFVARGDGSHEFTATLDEHNRAVQKYQLHRKP
jgi:UPF0755 protein